LTQLTLLGGCLLLGTLASLGTYLLASKHTQYITVTLEFQANASKLFITNVYGPNLDEDRPSFSQELEDIANQIQGSRLLAGDFNSIRAPQDRSTGHMAQNEQ
jgi:O-glycosyl hydrolase